VRTLRRELLHSSLRFSAILLGAVASVIGVTNSYPLVASWSNLAAACIAAAAFSAPFWAGLGAWEALRSVRRRLGSSEGTAALSVVAIRGPHYLAVVVWTLAGTVLSTGIVITRGMAIGVHDDPTQLAFALPFVANLLSVSVGFAAGHIIRRWFAIIVAVAVMIGLYVVELLRVDPYWVQASSPLHRLDVPQGTAINGTTIVGQLAVALGLIGVCLLVGLFLSARDRLAPVTAAFASASLLYFGGSLVASQGGLSFDASREADLVTLRAESGLALDVLPIYSGEAAENLTREWDRISTLFAMSDLAFNSLTQDLNPTYPEDEKPGPPYRLDLNPASRDIAGASIDAMFNDIRHCQTQGDIPEDSWPGGSVVFQLWIRGEKAPQGVSLTPETVAMVDRLRAMPLPAAQEWVADHVDDIVNCTWQRSDFQ
jgi:hypothetical protein